MVVPYYKKLSEQRISIHRAIPLSRNNKWQSKNEDDVSQAGLDRGLPQRAVTCLLFSVIGFSRRANSKLRDSKPRAGGCQSARGVICYDGPFRPLCDVSTAVLVRSFVYLPFSTRSSSLFRLTPSLFESNTLSCNDYTVAFNVSTSTNSRSHRGTWSEFRSWVGRKER